jgi:4-diphosphocytidyl-2-C-methyl-D-erythritol kinase
VPKSDIVTTLKLQCPAKINETLSVGAPDERGYHPIETVFQAVGLFDSLTISLAEEDSFTCDRELQGTNTVERAWNLLREYMALPPLAVTLEKRIPAESGLGGGSSDAAAFLRGANELLGRKLSPDSLFEIASAVGADVPFFLVGGRAEGRGYGEKLTPLPDGATRWLILAKPDVSCSTAAMYRRLDEVGRPRKVQNDFELVAPEECIELIERLHKLGSKQSGLSGSGSACFGYFASQNEADIAATKLPGTWRRVVRTLSREESLPIT